MKKRLTMRQKKSITGLLFISPWLIGICVFFLWNLIQTIIYSFNDITIPDRGGYVMTYMGLDNYANILFRDVNFNRELVASLGAMVINVPMIIFFSLFMALLLNRKFMFRGLVRAVFFLPVVMSTSAISTSLEQVLLMMMGGVSSINPQIAQSMETGFNATSVAYLLMDFGMPEQVVNYIVDALFNLYGIIRASGVQILIFLAALQSIPGSLYEVSQIEGATAYEAFWKITIPMVSPLILTNVVYTIVDTFAQSTIVTLAYDTAFYNMDFGISSAMSLISSLAACLFLFIVSWLVSRYVYYQN